MIRNLQLLTGCALLGFAVFLVFRKTDSRPLRDSDARSIPEAAPVRNAGNGDRRVDHADDRKFFRDLARMLRDGLDSENDDELSLLVSGTGGENYLKVLEIVRSDKEFAPQRIQMEAALLRSWSLNDPDSALTWAVKASSWEREDLFDRIYLNAASKYPEKAMSALIERRGFENGHEVAENIADSWAMRDLHGLMEWAGDLPQGRLRDRMFAKVSEGTCLKDPPAAVRLALAEIPPGDLRDDVMVAIASQWGRQDPEGAGRWVDRFPPSGLQRRVKSELEVVKRR